MDNFKNPLILIIDDEEAILKTLKDALTDEDYRVETLSDGRKGLDLIGKLIPDLLLLDIFMPNCNGLKLLTQIKKEYQRTISSFRFKEVLLKAFELHKIKTTPTTAPTVHYS